MDALSGLAVQARAGDQRAFERFVEAGYQDVWRFCASLVDAGAADDLSQETFARAVQALPRFRAQSSARTWLLAIARHVCADELRSRSRRRQRETMTLARPSGGLGQPGAARRGLSGTCALQDDHSEHVGLVDLLGQLGPDQHAAFVLTQVIGLSYKEAAAVCACPVGTVRSRVARARAELLDLLEQAEAADRSLRSAR